MKFVLSIVIMLFICPACFSQQLTEPPPTMLLPSPDPIGHLNSDQELNRTLECCDLWFQRKIAREQWEKYDLRLDEIVDEKRALNAFLENIANDPDLTTEAKIEILNRVSENLRIKVSEEIMLEEAMDELRILIHLYNEQWLLKGCGFYPTI